MRSSHVRLIEGDVLGRDKLTEAMQGQGIVYANLGGQLDKMTENIIKTKKISHLSRLIFINSIGIYDEMPGAFGRWNKSMLANMLSTYRKAADLIGASGPDYTILRTGWLTNKKETD